MAKVLVVDDEEHMAAALAERLAADGHEVKTLGEGELVIEELKKEQYDLLMMDLRLPGMSGLETMDALREENSVNLDKMAIVILSSVDNPVVSKYVNANGYTYLIKADNSLDDIAEFAAGELKKKKG